MRLKKNEHSSCLDALVERLERKYPSQRMWRNVEYLSRSGKVIGEIDLLREVSENSYVMYEVKTGKSKIYNAKQQYRRFKQYNPTDTIKGVYVHPNHIERLR